MTDSDSPAPIHVRPYASDDASSTLRVFISAVTTTAAADYSARHIAVWAQAEERTVADWDAARSAVHTVVAEIDGEVVGFSDIDADGLVDMMFVSPDYGRRGVARELLQALVERAVEAGTSRLSTSSSITARPFFEAQGFSVVASMRVVVGGVPLSNFRMVKSLRAARK